MLRHGLGAHDVPCVDECGFEYAERSWWTHGSDGVWDDGMGAIRPGGGCGGVR